MGHRRAKNCCENEQERAEDSAWCDFTVSELVCVDVSLQSLSCDDKLCFLNQDFILYQTLIKIKVHQVKLIF